ncbi:MAG TPA: response regulator, partial [Candidatus Eisenbacteria bacterium]|nr:response regulator [Candidatus Eisenbacteria bacterium]
MASGTPAKKVIIVEDDKALANVLEDKLKSEGFSVTKAVNGEEGLTVIKTVKPNLIILDLMMPVMGGQAMLHRLRDIPEFKLLPVIVL